MPPSLTEVSSARLRLQLLAALAAACASWPGPARGEASSAEVGNHAPISKAACAESFEQSQRLRNSFLYLEAAAEALRCASLECGAALSEECGRLYSDLQAATPSIVLGARSGDGSELGNVVVSIDGSARQASLDGTPLLLNPGHHEFTFSADGFKQSQQVAVILAGERFRPIVGVLAKEQTSRAESARETKLATGERGGVPVTSYVLGGVAVIGLAGFVGLRLMGAHDYDALARDCKPTCPATSVDAARQKYVLSYVGLAVGGAASIAAVTVYLASPRQPSRRATTLQLRQQPDGVSAYFTAPF